MHEEALRRRPYVRVKKGAGPDDMDYREEAQDVIAYEDLQRLPWGTLIEYTTVRLPQPTRPQYCVGKGCRCSCSSTGACKKHKDLPAFAMFGGARKHTCRYCKIDAKASHKRKNAASRAWNKRPRES